MEVKETGTTKPVKSDLQKLVRLLEDNGHKVNKAEKIKGITNPLDGAINLVVYPASVIDDKPIFPV